MDNFPAKKRTGILLVLLSALMFGSYGVWSRLLGGEFGVFYQGWSRALIITIVLLPILIYRKEIKPIARKDWPWLIFFLIFTSATQAPIFYAFNHMDIGTATLLLFVSMLLTMYFVGFAFLKEKLTTVKAVSFFVALAGLFFTFSISLAVFSLLAALMAVLNGIASGGEVSSSKKLSHNYSPLYITWLSWVIIIITNGILSVALGETQHLPAFNIVWLYQVGYTIASIFGFWAVIAGLKYIEASIGGLIGLLEIVFSIAFGVIIFHEFLSLRVIIGGLLIITAAGLPHVVDLIDRRRNFQSKSM